ncbi:4-amino-4-deoxy-L-arabinose transferase [Rathayibacter sp. AY1C3]|nr:4-amino-4-deoxy-L-arabinose transferase [Rathayibacter sp. AY1A4]PPG74777.1 4-amino-4-deoxy-L-arabinose transferase [Rathayibacter sp. AY1E5]PPH26239.1 4-amino-4-deoxy-L-arabinose transferase [Rathayibacter sp. AY1C3]PPH62135.1 4-amino-4-deoxy-L-arabinose transferase [Rathayibacter sp. AY1D7]PPI27418.1 4-amino-4-deoxy-L-arabinose transferase [Rathayibacter sp. AY1B4]
MIGVNRAGADTAGTDIRIGPNAILRFLLELVALATFALWGFASWDLPWNIVLGIGAPVVAALIWALFLSPRAVLAIDVYGRSLIELLVMGAAALAWLDLGQPVVAIVFGVLAVVSGVIAGRRSL